MIHYNIESLRRRRAPKAGVATLALLLPLVAAQAASAQDAAPPPVDDHHLDDEIIVTGAIIRNKKDVLSSVAVLSASDLAIKVRPSIGETLDSLPGVSASSFGPTASRPVLRGMQGERVRVLSDGIGSIDASNTSVDHAMAINPLLATRIEVLRGPQSLLYGSSAIGGVVNVIDSRLPTTLLAEKFHVGALATYGSAANERSLSGAVDLQLGGGWVLHGDGSWSKSDDLKIGGYALSPALRAQALASSLLPPDPDSEVDFAANAALRGTLPNSAARTWTAGGGISYVGSGGSIGVAYTRTDSLYGLPVRYATLPGEEQEAARVRLQQDRIDGKATVKLGGALLDSLNFRVGYADYRHSELEEDGAIGTTFFTKGIESRLELIQANRGGWKGVSGVQYAVRDFDVVGEEAFLPRNTSSNLGFFTLQSLTLGNVLLEAGLRYEGATLTAKPLPTQPQFPALSRRFDTLSGAIGGAWTFAEGWKVGLNLSRTSRAPSAEELFANGPHAGTSSFEIGNPDLKPERAWSGELILRGSGDGYSLEASLYRTWFNGYIFEAATGALEDGLPVYVMGQADARFWGFEVQGSMRLAKFGPWTLNVEALADRVEADIDSYGPAPRIPPLRLKGGLALNSNAFDLHAEVERVMAQNRTAPNETATPGFTMVNLEAAWRPFGSDRPLSFTLSANNLFDVNARRHASYLKDYAPLAGRDIRLGVRLEY